MTSITTFYLSRIIGQKVLDHNGIYLGTVKDLLVDPDPSNYPTGHPVVKGIKIKYSKNIMYYSFENFHVEKVDGNITVICDKLIELPKDEIDTSMYLAEAVLDNQIVDLNGRKLVRVNDVSSS